MPGLLCRRGQSQTAHHMAAADAGIAIGPDQKVHQLPMPKSPNIRSASAQSSGVSMSMQRSAGRITPAAPSQTVVTPAGDTVIQTANR